MDISFFSAFPCFWICFSVPLVTLWLIFLLSSDCVRRHNRRVHRDHRDCCRLRVLDVLH